MGNLTASVFRAMGSVFTPGMLGVFVLSIVVTVLVLTGFVAAASAFFIWAAGLYSGQAFAEWLPWLGSIGAGVLAWMLFPGITPIIVSFFDVRITRLIEQHDYPASPAPVAGAFLPEFLHDLRFALMAVALNILVLPLYLLPGLNLVLFYLLNGYLLGREYFVMVARRHMPLEQAGALRRRHGRAVFAGGVLLAFLATLPLVNLVAPFWGIALMVHFYHAVVGTKAQLLPPEA